MKTLTTTPMTSSEATHFQGVSKASFLQVQEAISTRAAAGVHPHCLCSPYEEVFTFNRWKAQGLSVKKGEKALRISSFVPVELKDRSSETERQTRLIPRELCLFCRCQVEENTR